MMRRELEMWGRSGQREFDFGEAVVADSTGGGEGGRHGRGEQVWQCGGGAASTGRGRAGAGARAGRQRKQVRPDPKGRTAEGRRAEMA
ncbi:unnamed protein product [Urochloa humidicola]